MRFHGKAFLFDLDWTILDYKFYPNIYNEIISKCNLDGMSPDKVRELIWTKSLFLMKSGRYLESHDWDFVLNLVLKDLNVECEISFSETVVNDVLKNGAPYKPGAREILRKLKNSGAIIGLLTNGYVKYQEVKVKVSRLDKLIDFIVYIDDAKSIKPFKEFFKKAIEIAEDLDATVISYVGDSLFFDVIGGLNSDIKHVVWYREKGDVPLGRYTLQDVKDHLNKVLQVFNGIISVKEHMNKTFYTINHHSDFFLLNIEF